MEYLKRHLKMKSCPNCGNELVAVYCYDNGMKHGECDHCGYLGPGAGSKGSPCDPGWLERELTDTAMRYRAQQFALAYPELVNSIADELGYQPPDPEDLGD